MVLYLVALDDADPMLLDEESATGLLGVGDITRLTEMREHAVMVQFADGGDALITRVDLSADNIPYQQQVAG